MITIPRMDYGMAWISDPPSRIALLTLTSLEIVPGIDNIIHFPFLALSILMLIGVSLLAEVPGFLLPAGYIDFSMGFSFFVEMLAIRLLRKTIAATVKLRQPCYPS